MGAVMTDGGFAYADKNELCLSELLESYKHLPVDEDLLVEACRLAKAIAPDAYKVPPRSLEELVEPIRSHSARLRALKKYIELAQAVATA